MIADGPLLQRASSVRLAVQSTSVTLNFTLSPEVPKGFSGYTDVNGSVYPSDIAGSIGKQWINDAPISLPSYPPCKRMCAGKARGPGVTRVGCTTKAWPITDGMWHSPNAAWGSEEIWSSSGAHTSGNPLLVISTAVHTVPANEAQRQASTLDTTGEAIGIYTGFIDVTNGTGSYSRSSCWLVPAILEYDVQWDSSQHVTITSTSNATSNVVSMVNNTEAQVTNASSIIPLMLNWFELYIQAYYSVNVTADFSEGIWSNSVETWGSWNPQSMKYLKRASQYDNDLELGFTDPLPVKSSAATEQRRIPC